MEFIKCDVCNSVFDYCFNIDNQQAVCCASVLFVKDTQAYIISHYGYSFDTSRVLVNRQSPLQQRQ